MDCNCQRLPADDFPHRSAESGSFRKGAPRSFTISALGQRAAFTRSSGPAVSALDLWVLDDLDSEPVERLLVSAADCGADDSALSPEERARRERMRESGGGITAFSADELLATVCFALGGQLWVCDVATGSVARVGDYEAVVDPRLNHRGDAIAFTAGRDFVVYSLAAAAELFRLRAEGESVTYGLADFVAAEELSRFRGHWWSPKGDQLLVERNDESAVEIRWLADPTYPASAPRPHRYPAAGTANSRVSLHWVDLGSGTATELQWDRAEFEYLADVSWGASGALITLLDRPQRHAVTFTVDQAQLSELHRQSDPAWVDVGVGAPAFAGERLVTLTDQGDVRYLQVGERVIDLGGRTVQSVVAASEERVVVAAYNEPWQLQIWAIHSDGSTVELSDVDGYAQAVAAGPYSIVIQQRPNLTQPEFRVLRGSEVIHVVANLAELPQLQPRLTFESVTEQALPTLLVWPELHVPGSHRLPVIVHIYGGPHHSEVYASGWRHATKQWLANQGFAVITIDNRGTPGKGPAWERAVLGDLATPVITDQVAALQALFEQYPDDLDPARVGITGWSFGGYLTALALLERPDVYRAGWSGAPVTDWRLYDTAYTERYLGHPAEQAENYERSSLLTRAAALQGTLCLVHGLADDNVLAAHSLQLSGALLAAGRPHRFLPLAGVSHMTPQVEVAKNLLLLMRDFFVEELA